MPVPKVHPPVRSSFATTDPDQGRQLIASAFVSNRMRLSGKAADFRLEQSRADLGPIQVDTMRYSLTTFFDADVPDRLLVCRFRDKVDVETENVERRFGPGDVCLLARPDRPFRVRIFGSDHQVIGMDPALLESVGENGAEATRRLRLDALPPERAHLWRRSVDFVTDTVLKNEETATSPLVLGSASRLLAATLLTVVGSEPPARPADRADAVPATVRRGIAYLEANPDLDIGVVDIARAAHVSVRALQLAFRRHLDTTPLTYLRRVRLEHAHTDLTNAVPGDGDTVTKIAARWGYARPSRFAADYRAAYGRHPHHVLRA